ncbi:hypothetical protein EC957_000869 [Mortierella hygrophila]|uniref:Uncharacterized protein n=1 Tax=Mortierella hygrophila TaxID=979708 RepID=A0A9P6F6H7_9FUNG|nr:hypothetical protein EC957_000869 [Mortierella hygrophila]
MSSQKQFNRLLDAVVSASKTPTPASFSSWGGVTNKAFAGDMYTRVYNRLLKSDLDSEKDRGRAMEGMWTNPKCKMCTTFHLQHWTDEDLEILREATSWFKKVTEDGVDAGIEAIKASPFRIQWISDLFYDRLKLIRVGGINPAWDENSYTSIWVNLDLTSLYTGVDGLISAAYANENHFTPSAWRRTLVRDKANQEGSNVDGFYVGTDNMVGLVVENVGSPTCSSFTKKGEDEEKCWRNTADALLERIYLSTGSFEVAKDYRVMSMVIYAREVTLYQTGIIAQNVYRVQKLFQGYYHSNKTLLANLMIHLKICLIIKRVMERNQEVNEVFNKSIDSDLQKEYQAQFHLRLHTTPKK